MKKMLARMSILLASSSEYTGISLRKVAIGKAVGISVAVADIDLSHCRNTIDLLHFLQIQPQTELVSAAAHDTPRPGTVRLLQQIDM